MVYLHDYSALRGLIKEKLGSEVAFAEAIGKSSTSISKNLNGKTAFSVEDIKKACEVLGIKDSEIAHYFFR